MKLFGRKRETLIEVEILFEGGGRITHWFYEFKIKWDGEKVTSIFWVDKSTNKILYIDMKILMARQTGRLKKVWLKAE